MHYKRILLKLSGESLGGDAGIGLHAERIHFYAEEIRSACEMNVELAVVIGGGNIFRGLKGIEKGFDRVQGDYMGMLATTINAMALQGTLISMNIPSVVLSGLPIEGIAEKFTKSKALDLLKKKNVLILAGGTGNPYFTTDSGAALRGVEIEADVLLKGTRVDGIYNADPEKDKNAVKYASLTYDETYQKKLAIMDLTAFTLCKENHLKTIVYDANTKGNLKKLLMGESIGTLVY
jgi:uridylate kinase